MSCEPIIMSEQRRISNPLAQYRAETRKAPGGLTRRAMQLEPQNEYEQVRSNHHVGFCTLSDNLGSATRNIGLAGSTTSMAWTSRTLVYYNTLVYMQAEFAAASKLGNRRLSRWMNDRLLRRLAGACIFHERVVHCVNGLPSTVGLILNLQIQYYFSFALCLSCAHQFAVPEVHGRYACKRHSCPLLTAANPGGLLQAGPTEWLSWFVSMYCLAYDWQFQQHADCGMPIVACHRSSLEERRLAQLHVTPSTCYYNASNSDCITSSTAVRQ